MTFFEYLEEGIRQATVAINKCQPIIEKSVKQVIEMLDKLGLL